MTAQPDAPQPDDPRATLTAAAATIQSTLAALEPPPPELQPDQFVYHPPIHVGDVLKLHIKLNGARKLLRRLQRGERLEGWDTTATDRAVHSKALVVYLELLLKCLAVMLPASPTAIGECLLRELRKLKKAVLCISERRRRVGPSPNELRAWKRLSRTDDHVCLRMVVTPERVAKFDAEAVSSLVQWCAVVVRAFGPSWPVEACDLVKVHALVAAMRFAPKHRPILMQLVAAQPSPDGAPPMPRCPDRWQHFPNALDVDMGPHLQEGVEYVEALARHAQALLVAGITKAKFTESFTRARDMLTALDKQDVGTKTNWLVDLLGSRYHASDPFDLLCVVVPLCMRLARLLDQKPCTARLHAVCQQAQSWKDVEWLVPTLQAAEVATSRPLAITCTG